MQPIENPFTDADALLDESSSPEPLPPIRLVDFHCELTSEKNALGLYLDGRVSVVVGTHTHVVTGDERILPGGTAYQTDLGMTGPVWSVIGFDPATVLPRFINALPTRFEVGERAGRLQRGPDRHRSGDGPGARDRADPAARRGLRRQRCEWGPVTTPWPLPRVRMGCHASRHRRPDAEWTMSQGYGSRRRVGWSPAATRSHNLGWGRRLIVHARFACRPMRPDRSQMPATSTTIRLSRQRHVGMFENRRSLADVRSPVGDVCLSMQRARQGAPQRCGYRFRDAEPIRRVPGSVDGQQLALGAGRALLERSIGLLREARRTRLPDGNAASGSRMSVVQRRGQSKSSRAIHRSPIAGPAHATRPRGRLRDDVPGRPSYQGVAVTPTPGPARAYS